MNSSTKDANLLRKSFTPHFCFLYIFLSSMSHVFSHLVHLQTILVPATNPSPETSLVTPAPLAPPRNTSGGSALFPKSCRDPTHCADWELTSWPVILPGYISPGSPRSIVRPPPAMAVRDSRIQAPGTQAHSQSWRSNNWVTMQNGNPDPSP